MALTDDYMVAIRAYKLNFTPVIFFNHKGHAGTISCHIKNPTIEHDKLLTELLGNVNIQFNKGFWKEIINVTIEQEFFLKSLLLDLKYSDKILGFLQCQ